MNQYKDFLEESEKEKKELVECYKEAKRQTIERTDPLESFSKDLRDSIKRRVKYCNQQVNKVMDIFHQIRFKEFLENTKREINEYTKKSFTPQEGINKSESEKLQEQLEPLPPCPMSDE